MFQRSNKEKVRFAKNADIQVISKISNLACTLSSTGFSRTVPNRWVKQFTFQYFNCKRSSINVLKTVE